MNVLLALILTSVLKSVNTGVIEKEIVAVQVGTFSLLAEYGVSTLGRSSLLFKVMTCRAAVMALSDIVSITNNKGRFFMILLGKPIGGKMHVMIRESCFKCNRLVKVEKTVLDCDKYKPFWVTWDSNSTIRIGEGLKLGQNLIIQYTALTKFKVRFTQVASLRPPAKFKFLVQEEIVFTAPQPDGSTKVFVKEDVAIGTVVYQIQVTPEVDLIMRPTSSHFKLSGKELRTTKLLDYEIDRFYMLSFKTQELEVNVTLTIIVEDVNDETPEVILGEGIKIPEELPVGFIVGGVFTATDRDANDSLTFTLEGKDSSYFTVIGMGQLRLEKHIDHDGPSGIKKLDLTLHVVDTANHDSAHVLTIVITDINDNVPTCTSGLFTKTIKPDAESDKPIMNIPCSDEDSGRNGQFSLRIVPNAGEKEHTKKFWLAGVDLFADITKLREEASKKESATYIMKLLAVDTPKSGRVNTGTAVVIINLPHRKPRRPNDHKPKWVSTSPDQDGNFPDQTVAENVPPGTVINRYYAEDLDPGSTVAYMINSIRDDKGENDTGPFIIDFKNGNLRTTGILDCDPGTGGVKYYELSLMATDGENVIGGFVRVIIKNSNDNQPVFNKMIYTYDAKTFKNFAKPIVTLNVADMDKGSQITLSLAKNALQYFRITPTSDAWHLKFRPGVDPREDSTIPSAITITASDNALEPKTSSAVVILKNLPCLPPTLAPTTANNLTARPTGTHVGTGTRSGSRSGGSGTRTSQKGSVSNIGIGDSSSGNIVALSADDYEEGSQGQHDVSNIPEATRDDFVCDPVSSQDSSRTGLYLKVACAVEGLIIVMTTLLVLAKRCGCLKKSSTAQGNPERKDPLGCENALRNQELHSRQSFKKKDGSSPKPGRSSITPTPTPSRLEIVKEVPEPDDDEAQISIKAFDASSTSAVIIDDEMTLTAKNKFLGLKKKADPAPPKQLYSSSSGVTLNDNEMISVARSKFLEKLKDPTPVAENEPEMVFIAKDRFKTLLAKEEGEPSVDMMKHLESSGSGMLAIAKDKFKGLTQTCGNPELDVEKETPPLNMVSLLDGSCFSAGDDSTVSLAKGKFMDMLKGNKTIGSYMTGNDAILEYASGYNPSSDTVYIAKDKFFDLIKEPEKGSGAEETLAIGKEDLMNLVKRDSDPWADPTVQVMEHVSGIDSENGVMFISKQKFLSLANKPDNANTEAMVTMSKPKLAELLQKRSQDAKSNETLNQYVSAISPVTGMVYMTKQKFLSLTQPENETSASDEVLEVDTTSLEELSKARGVNKIIIGPHTLGEATSRTASYIAKSRFLQLTSKCVGNDEDGILEVSKDTFEHMTEQAGDLKVSPIAKNQSSDSVFITKKTFLQLASHEYEDQDVVMLSKEKAGEMIAEEDDKDEFLKEKALAVMPSSGQVFVAKDKFMLMMKQKRTQNDENEDESDGELVSVPKDQLTDLLKGGEQRCKSFIRTHAEAFNAATGAVFMARKKFLTVAGKIKSGKEEDEVVSVPKEDLLEMVSSNGKADGQNLDKHALALSEDGQKAFIAKSKFMALTKKRGADIDKSEESEMIAVTEESLSQMIGDDRGKTGEFLKKYAKAFNPEKKVAYLAKDKFLKLAKHMTASKSTDGEDEEEMIAVPKEKLMELTGDKSDSDDKSSVMKHALAFNDSIGTAYLAKSRFMKLIEKSKPVSKDGQNEGECEMVTVPQDQLEQLISAGNESQTSNTDYLKKIATAINPITKMVYLSRNKFSEIARKSVNSAENVNHDNDIVGVQESQLSAMLNQEKGGDSVLKKHALAFNKTSGHVYFLKRKFKELASKIPKGNRPSDQESMICESIVSSPDTSTAAKTAENEATAGEGKSSNVQIHIENSPIDSASRSTSDSDYAQAYPPGILNSDLNNMLIRDQIHGTSSSSGDNGMEHLGYNDYRNQPSDSDESDDSSDESGDSILDEDSGRPRVVLTITDDPYNEEDRNALERKKLKTPHTNTFGKLQSREAKKKKKVKAWDPEVRNRLYATPSGKGKDGGKTKKKGKSKSKVSPENDLSDVGGKKKGRKKKSRIVHPEPDTVTSETDESYLGVQQHTKKGKKRR